MATAAQAYAEAVLTQSQRIGTVTKQEYTNVWRATEYARLTLERARLDYESHTAEHGC
jgi:hypothetical protein